MLNSNVNNFNGIKISQTGVSVNHANDNQLTYKQNFDTGTMTVYGTNGNISFGVNPDNTLGMNIQDTKGNLLFEMSGQTWYWYDTNGNNIMQVGLLEPLNIFGWAVAVPGQDLKMVL